MADAANRVSFCFIANPIAKSVNAVGISQRFRLKPLLVSCTVTPFPSKRMKRRNQLRQKILKTLTEPYPTASLPQIETPIPAAPPPEHDTVFELPSDEIPDVLETDKAEDLRLSESIGVHGTSVGRFPARSVLKYPWFVFGVLFVLLICVVWSLDGFSPDEREERELISLDGTEKVFLDKDGHVVYFDVSKMEERIKEIRAMAREARDSEKRNFSKGNEWSDIDNEIVSSLLRLEKRSKSKKEKEKYPASMMNYLGWFGNENDEFTGNASAWKEDNESLMFNKRFKNSKGFTGSKDGEREVKNSTLNSVKPVGNDLEKESEILQDKMSSGAVQETIRGKSSTGLKQPHESRNQETYDSAPSKPGDQAAKKLDKPASQSSKELGGKQSVQTDSWWLNLQYVFAIVMRRDAEEEVREGLYTLRTFGSNNLEDSAYTLAFEDRGDANNFCSLLESYFEDLGDFSADIVPLFVKEAYDKVRSHSKEMLVIKKRQLKLYAGQPFEEVETVLRSLIGQNQTAS